jgi:hypothetical protein
MITRRNLILYLLFYAYIFSILYFPLEVLGSSIITRVVPLIILLIILILLFEKIKIKHLKKYLSLFLIIVLFSISSIYELNSIIYLVNFFLYSLFFLVIYTSFDSYGYDFIQKYSKLLYLFAVFASLLAIFEYFFYYEVNKIFLFRGSPYYESKGQVCSLYSNPNIFGLLTALSMQLGFIAYKSKVKVLWTSLIIIIGVVLSGSRMSLAILLLTLFINLFKIRFSSFIMVFMSIFLLIGLSILSLYFSGLIDLNFRDMIWNASIDAFHTNPYFGLGIGNFQNKIDQFLDIDWLQGANNMFWGLLVEAGAITSIAFYLFLLGSAFSRKKLKAEYYTFDSRFGLLLSFLIISQFSEYFIIYVIPYLFLLFVSISAIKFNKVENEKNITS